MAMAGEAQRDRDLLLHIKRYCDDALDAAQQVGSEAEFLKNRLYQHAIAMCVLELANCPSICLWDFSAQTRRFRGGQFAGCETCTRIIITERIPNSYG